MKRHPESFQKLQNHYDSIAHVYERVAAPGISLLFAKELVAEMQLCGGTRVLDLGAGSGVVSGLVKKIVSPDGLVIALDLSETMLRLAREKNTVFCVMAKAPGLPFRAGVIDAVLAHFVLNHIDEPTAFLAELFW